MGPPVVLDAGDFLRAGQLLYAGPWVAERLAAVGDFAAAHPDQVHPVTRAVLDSGRGYSAADAFRGLHRLAALRAATRPVWESVDVLLVPTVPTTFTVDGDAGRPGRAQLGAGALHDVLQPARPVRGGRPGRV